MIDRRKVWIVSMAASAAAIAPQPVMAREWSSPQSVMFKYQPIVAPVMMPPWSFVSRTGSQCNTGAAIPLSSDYASGTWLKGKHGGLAGDLPRIVRSSQNGAAEFTAPDGTKVRKFAAHIMVPGPANTCAITRFTVPATQPAGVSYTVTFLTLPSSTGPNSLGGGNGAAAFLVLNGAKIGPTIMTAAAITTGSNQVIQTITMSPGDTLDLAVNPLGSPLGDATETFFRIVGPDPAMPPLTALSSMPPIPTLGCVSGGTAPSLNLSTGQPVWYANYPGSSVNVGVASASHPFWDQVPGANWITTASVPVPAGTYKFSTKVQISACPGDPEAKLKLRFLGAWDVRTSVNGTMLPAMTAGSQAAGMKLYTHTFPVGASGVQELTFHVKTNGFWLGDPAFSANVLATR